jgi:asparagine synthetase B (glutamine-hydrolysing)
MCGIVGILGREPVGGALVDALKRLEYRGYDSAGVATLEACARGRRNPPRIAARASLPDLLASNLDVPARGSAHAPARRGGAQIPRR